MLKLNALVAGSTGYIGCQLIKILVKHKYINIKYLCGNSSVGKKISFFEKSLSNKKLPKIIKFNKKLLKDVDIIFTALPNGEAQDISKHLNKNNTLIDLAADFRLEKKTDYQKWYKQKHRAVQLIKKSIYSLPEINRNEIKKYNIISSPGCYPTSILLPLIPLFEKNLVKVKNVIIDSKSGYSGAGKDYKKKFKHKNFYNSVFAYSTTRHRHMSELDQELNKLINKKINYTFNPHLLPTFRGIISSIYLNLPSNVNISKIHKELKTFYRKDHFIKILNINTAIGTGNVLNTNFCEISVCKTRYKNKIIILSSIDNLVKGASGQAVQNMNLLYGLKENIGL